MLSEVDDPTDYEAMDQVQFLDELYFEGGQLTDAEGEQFKAEMDEYRTGMVELIGTQIQLLADQLKSDFSTEPITLKMEERKKAGLYLL